MKVDVVIEKVTEWSLKVMGWLCLLTTVVEFFAMFWKGLYCLGVAVVAFFLSQICLSSANDVKETFKSFSK